MQCQTVCLRLWQSPKSRWKKKNPLIIFLSFKYSSISPYSVVSITIFFHCLFFSFAFLYLVTNLLPNFSLIQLPKKKKNLVWQRRKLRIHDSLFAQTTTFSMLVINLLLSIFNSRMTFRQKILPYLKVENKRFFWDYWLYI